MNRALALVFMSFTLAFSTAMDASKVNVQPEAVKYQQRLKEETEGLLAALNVVPKDTDFLNLDRWVSRIFVEYGKNHRLTKDQLLRKVKYMRLMAEKYGLQIMEKIRKLKKELGRDFELPDILGRHYEGLLTQREMARFEYPTELRVIGYLSYLSNGILRHQRPDGLLFRADEQDREKVAVDYIYGFPVQVDWLKSDITFVIPGQVKKDWDEICFVIRDSKGVISPRPRTDRSKENVGWWGEFVKNIDYLERFMIEPSLAYEDIVDQRATKEMALVHKIVNEVGLYDEGLWLFGNLIHRAKIRFWAIFCLTHEIVQQEGIPEEEQIRDFFKLIKAIRPLVDGKTKASFYPPLDEEKMARLPEAVLLRHLLRLKAEQTLDTENIDIKAYIERAIKREKERLSESILFERAIYWAIYELEKHNLAGKDLTKEEIEMMRQDLGQLFRDKIGRKKKERK